MGQTRKRSGILMHFSNKGNDKAECNVCRSNLSYKAGSTNNLRRHLNSHHPWVQVAEDVRRRRSHNDNDEQENAASVEVTLEDSDTHTTVMDADNSSAINGILDAAQGSLAEEITHEEESDDRSVKCRQKKRSLVWRHYEYLDSLAAARCRICMKKLQCSKGSSTSNLHRHLSNRHPGVFSQLVAIKQHPSPPHSSQGSNANMEVTLEDSDIHTTVNDADVNSAINGILEAAQGSLAEEITHEEESDDRSVKRKRNKRSLVWRHYEYLDSLAAARCRICMKKLQCSEGSSTGNLHRHLSNRHPGVFSQLLADKQHPSPPNSSQGSNANVEVTLEDSDTHTTVMDADNSSAINGILDAAQGSLAEEITHEEESDDHPVKQRRNKHSLVWRHYEYLDSLAAARCRICMKKLQCSKGSSTSNLHRHLSNRHPGVFSQLVAVKQHPSPPHSSQGSGANSDTSTPPETVGAPKKQRQFSGKLKVSRASEGETRVLRRERELIEALRRVQKEEARAVEHQRELLENLRAVNAREAAAERQQIESLRKAQLEEAKDLSRQREEVQKEKTQLQKKWEELQQEREELVLLLSKEQQAS
ncbi:uncharacterized protein LOC117947571 isoform X2 [Etheostoma cragini]|uniref:uncharacterized protein LOC117947571 isoform X2 n=1 Tax=Etheostoma cragini TaxID=417921 RepID=UPI00155F238B|nr:uncharacterized protein LOC117947571 isoform X2 [Etheostoma cragini]